MNECITFKKQKTRKLQIVQHFVGFQLAGAAPVCRADGKPSTRFPPGTHRAEPTFTSYYRWPFVFIFLIWNIR